MSDAARFTHPISPEAAALAAPAGAWAVGVSGGADSVALLCLMRARVDGLGDVSLHVVHLDHQLRGQVSSDDAAFVSDLAAELGLPCTSATLADVEARLTSDEVAPANPSARYRAVRHALFREVTATHRLAGVLLAHHADDQAETILHRLLRNSGHAGLVGMEPQITIGGLTVARPLLRASGLSLRTYLRDRGQPWREDASNASDDYARNRLRRALRQCPTMVSDLLALGDACAALRDWTRANAIVLDDAFPVRSLADAPALLARESARRWLIARGAPPAVLAPAVLDQLIVMAADAATPSAQHFPGGVLVRRTRGQMRAV